MTGIDPQLAARRDEVIDVVSRHGARNVRVFGSRCRGAGGPESDLDILIDLDTDRSLLDIVAIKQDLEDLLGLKVDVLTEAALSPYILKHVLREAVSL